MKTAILDSPLGSIEVKGNDFGLVSVTFLDQKTKPTSQAEVPPEVKDAHQQLTAYFKGNRKDFDLKLNLHGTEFQRKVWECLGEISYGKTATYLDIAKRLGDAKTIRAAASANGKNPIAIIIPCHRVIGTDGSLTGYAGRLWRKKWLLEHEQNTEQLSLF